MQKIFFFALGILLCWQIGLAAEEDYTVACEKECAFLTKSCTAYLECSVAKINCQSSCMQRKVWEKVAKSLDNLSTVLEKQAREKEERERVSQSSTVMPSATAQTENASKGIPAAITDSGKAKP